jgi:hypothetical protein
MENEMEWSNLNRLPEKTLGKVHRLMIRIYGNDDKYYILKGEEGLKTVLKCLGTMRTINGKPLSTSTIQGYVSAISRSLKEIGENNDVYRQKVNEYAKEMLNSDGSTITPVVQGAKDVLERLMYKCSKDMAVIAGLIYYSCPKKMQLQHLLTTRCDEDTGVDNYLDLENYIFVSRRAGYPDIHCDVPVGYIDFIKELKIKSWLLGSKKTSAQSVSNTFKRTAGYTYTQLRTNYCVDSNDESEILSEPETKVELEPEPKPKIKVRVIKK